MGNRVHQCIAKPFTPVVRLRDKVAKALYGAYARKMAPDLRFECGGQILSSDGTLEEAGIEPGTVVGCVQLLYNQSSGFNRSP